MGARLERSRRVLRDYEASPGDRVTFKQDEEVENPGDPRTTITFDHQTWVDMDKPDTITVSIEPGDKIND